MHEQSVLADLIRKVEDIARAERAVRVRSVTVKLGVLCHLSAAHLREHFRQATVGTILAEARLEVEELHGVTDPNALDVILDRVIVDV